MNMMKLIPALSYSGHKRCPQFITFAGVCDIHVCARHAMSLLITAAASSLQIPFSLISASRQQSAPRRR